MSILIDATTTFIVQGITGREAVNLTRECLDYGAGAKVVGGVTPGRLGCDVHGVPVFDTVAQAVEAHGGPIDGSVVTVPPAFTKDAVLEAIANGVKLVVIVTERIPRGDVAQMVEFADEHGARIIGPNCLGIIVPDVIKMGGIGGPARNARQAYSPGPVGVIKACLELDKDPAETIAIFRIPGAWEEEGFKILDRYGVEYCDRSVSMYEAAGRAVAKIQGAPAE